jgi:glutamyl-tRNA synthetase
MLLPFLHQKGYAAEKGNFLCKVIRTLAPRVKTLVEMAEAAAFYYVDEIVYQPDAAAKFLNGDHLKALHLIRNELDALDPVTETNLEEAFHRVAGETGWKLGKIAQPVRVALTGKTASPGIFEIIEIIGKQRVMERISRAIGWIEQQAATG